MTNESESWRPPWDDPVVKWARQFISKPHALVKGATVTAIRMQPDELAGNTYLIELVQSFDKDDTEANANPQ